MGPALALWDTARNATGEAATQRSVNADREQVRSLQQQLGLHRNGIFTEACSHDDSKLFHATSKLLCALSHAMEVLFCASPAHPTYAPAAGPDAQAPIRLTTAAYLTSAIAT